MGEPMSSQVAGAGFRTVITDQTPGLADRLAEADERIAGTLADVAACDAVVLMLPNSEIVEAVLLREGLLDQMARGSVLIDMSSSDPRSTVALAPVTAERGVAFADAPVSGGVARARKGELTVIVGAELAVLERIRPLLESMAANIFHVGASGSGHAAKALNNLLSATGLLISIEAVEAGARFGIDPHVLVALLNVSTGMNHATKTKIEQYVLSEQFNSGFRAALMLKDLRLAGELCQEFELGTGLAGHVVEEWAAAYAQLAPDADQTEIAHVTRNRPSIKKTDHT